MLFMFQLLKSYSLNLQVLVLILLLIPLRCEGVSTKHRGAKLPSGLKLQHTNTLLPMTELLYVENSLALSTLVLSIQDYVISQHIFLRPTFTT